jgi:hypothetical protein
MNPFEFLNSINSTKKDLLEDPDNESQYNSFMVNRGLSYFYDTVLLANEMNLNHQLDSKMQYDFLMKAVRQRKRFSKWEKKNKMPSVELIKEKYGYSTSKAESVVDLFTDEQLESIEKELFKGGKK